MQIWEMLLIGVALAMDAVAVGMTNGMEEPKMPPLKMIAIAGAFGLFQFLMPVIGYYLGYAFTFVIERIAPFLSFALLAFIGGKMIFDGIVEQKKRKRGEMVERKQLGAAKLVVQAVATSLDALAVGITLRAAETAAGLPMHAVLVSLAIGAITFVLVLPAVLVGKKAGNAFSDKAELFGGVVLILIGIKILVESLI